MRTLLSLVKYYLTCLKKPSMKILNYFALVAIFCFLTLMGVTYPITQKQFSVKVTIQTTTQSQSGILIVTNSNLVGEDALLAEGEFDSSGKTIIEFALSKPTFATLKAGRLSRTIYLAPGYDLVITYGETLDESLRFHGTGADVNNYLVETHLVREKFLKVGTDQIVRMDSSHFLRKLDSLEQTLLVFHNEYIGSVRLPERTVNLLLTQNKVNVAEIRQNYAWHYRIQNNYQAPGNLSMVDEIPLDTMLLNQSSPEYGKLLRMNMQIQFYSDLWRDKTPAEAEYLQNNAPLAVNELIIKKKFPEPLEEFMRARNIHDWMEYWKLAPAVDTLYRNFSKQYPESRWLPTLKKNYDILFNLSAGKVAPDFSGVDIEGKRISLSDLKGKVVYADVWATWCGPCLEEMPHLEKLIHTFRESNEIVFVLISIDKSAAAWKRHVQEDMKTLPVYNILETKEGSSAAPIRESYHLESIPKNLLIDKEGNIVSADALHPSSGDRIETEIRKLLKH
jgi:thiol-disulfide isomerase/thioredoxin